MRKLIAIASAVALAILGIGLISSASASPGFANTVTYSGQGLNADGSLQDNECGDGVAPYLLFVLTATKATQADITLPTGTVRMSLSGNGHGNGSFKYTAPYMDPSSLIGVVVASYDGAATNAQLVISHGCVGPVQTTPPPSPSPSPSGTLRS